MQLPQYPRYDSYKPSGVEWLGDVPEDWQVTPGRACLYENKDKNTGMQESTVLSLSYGNVIVKPEEKLTGLVPESFETYQIVEPGDIIIRGTDLQNDVTSLRTGLARDRGIITSAYINLRPHDNVLPFYLHYVLHSYDVKKVFYGLGSGLRQNLSYEDFKYLDLPLPDIPTQERIVALLDDKTDKINRAVQIKEGQIALLRERKQIIIQEAVTKGLNPDAPMKDSGIDWIGQIPAHWDVKRIKHLTTKVGSGITPTGGALTYIDDGIPLLRSQNVHFGRIDLSGVARIAPRVHQSMSNSHVAKGDVLLNITGGSIGRCHFVDEDEPLNVNQHVCILRPSRAIQTQFLNACLASEIGQKQIWFFQQGGGREGLNFEAIKNFWLPVPTPDEQAAIISQISAEVEKFDQAIELKERQIEALIEYKATLINAAVTGKIKVI